MIDFSYDQAVLIDIDFKGFEDFGTAEQQAKVRKLEEALKSALPEKSGFDGDEFGEGQATVYLYGPSAEKIFKKIEPILKRSDFEHMDITLQYGRPDDPNTKDKKFTL
jgi:hypothetical protein